MSGPGPGRCVRRARTGSPCGSPTLKVISWSSMESGSGFTTRAWTRNRSSGSRWRTGPAPTTFTRSFLEDPATKYDVTYEALDEVGGRQTHRLRLVPRARSSYKAAVIWIDQREPVLRQIRIEDENDTVRTITLERVDLDPIALDDDWFTFTPPPGDAGHFQMTRRVIKKGRWVARPGVGGPGLRAFRQGTTRAAGA